MEHTDTLLETVIDNGSPVPVTVDIRTRNREEALPVVIICHGFLGYKRWGFLPYLSARLARSGFHVLTMSFSMNGVDEKTGLFTRRELFRKNTVSREIEDLESTCEYIRGGSSPLLVSTDGWGIVGYSRGASVAMLAIPGIAEIHSLVTWSTPSRLDRYTERRKVQWKRNGALVFEDSRSSVPLQLDYSYYEDIDANRQRFDLRQSASRLNMPHLMVHGERDAAVTLNEAKELLRIPRSGETKLEVIKNCGHTYGVTHPMKKTTPFLEQAVCLTERWFDRTLR